MSPPWISKRKSVGPISNVLNSAPAHVTTPALVIPNALRSIAFNPNRLFASIARCNSVSPAPLEILLAQQAAADAAIRWFVSELGPEFAILDSVYLLGDAKFVSIAHDIGAGIANLYMHDLGFQWFANAKEFIIGDNKKPDYIYSSKENSSEVVIMEAKGSMGRSVTKSDIVTRVNLAYFNQIEPWLATTVQQATIVGGYAIGSLAKAGASITEMIVSETFWPSSAKPAKPAVGVQAVPAAVALANYRAVFQLMQAFIVVRFIGGILINQFRETAIPDTQFFQEVRYLGKSYLIAAPLFAIWNVWQPEKRFALDLLTAKEFFDQLSSPSFDEGDFFFEGISRGALEDANEGGNGALFGDGFAFIPMSDPVRMWRWTPQIGLTAD